MSGISSTTGLISGIDFTSLVDQLMELERQPAVIMEDRVETFSTTQSALALIESNLTIFSSAFTNLGESDTINAVQTSNSDTTQLSATTDDFAALGSYHLQTLQVSSRDQYRSKGFSDLDTSAIGAGTITIASDGFLDEPTLLEELHGGEGIRRGSIEITDRSGSKTEIDLSSAYSVDEVLDAINSNESIDVTAYAEGDKLVLRDNTGSSSSNLIVTEVSGGHTAEDLGLLGSVADDQLTGSKIFEITSDFSLAQLNDGNGLRLLENAPDLKITLTDDTVLSINLDSATSIQNVINQINDHEDNGGKLLASFENERFKLEDLSGGGGSSSFTIEDTTTSSVIEQLGLDVAESGGVITSRKLSAGMNSVLLRNLNSGQGIETLGTLEITDRAGNSASLDLSGAESLDEIITAINNAETGGGTKLQLRAAVDEKGTGIVIEDLSGASASNLIIADSGGSTIAADLNIAVDDAVTQVDSGSLNLQYITEASSLNQFAASGTVSSGSIKITDSEGRSFSVNVSSSTEDIGDLIQRFESAQGDITGSEPVLLSNLNGGEGIGTLGTIDITDRAGNTASLDLSGATTLDEVITAINDAETAGLVPLELTARINDSGDGIIIEDSSGATASNLIIADSGGSTLAADLGITIDDAVTEIDSGSLDHRSVELALNETGDGFEIIDHAGGSDEIQVEDIDSDTAQDLGLSGEGTTGGDGKSRLGARIAKVITIEQGDTLDDLLTALNEDNTHATGAVFSTGSTFNPYRLTITSKESGAANRLVIETSGIDLGLDQTGYAADARLRLGPDAETGFVLSSNDDNFEDVAGYLDVTVLEVGTETAEIEVTRNESLIQAEMTTFINTFNTLVDTTNQLTKFDLDANEKGILQGNSVVLRMRTRMDTLLTKRFGSNDNVQTLADLGITFGEGGEIELNQTIWDKQMLENPDDVADFFLNEDNGFAQHGTNTIDSLIDPFTGTLSLEKNALQDSIDSLNNRIEQLDEILEVRRQRLLLQFVKMEETLALLQTQQSSLSNISSINS